MKSVFDNYRKKGELHHAYCIFGNTEEILTELERFFEKDMKFPIHGNPDFWYGEYDTLDVEDSRKLKELHQNKPTLFERKIFIVNTNFITEKAQNAMLKLFEEPSGDTHFFLIIPSSNNLLPTLRSRMHIIEHEGSKNSILNVKTFLGASVGERMNMVKKLAESISDEEESKIEVVKFINGLESEFFQRQSAPRPVASSAVVLGSSLRESAHFLENIEKMRQYANEQSPSLKMILEYMALIAPAD